MTLDRKTLATPVAAVLLAALASAPALAEMTVLYALDGETGKFARTAAYDIAPAIALEAFEAEAAGPESGANLYHNGGVPVPAGGGDLMSSVPAEGFASFLAAHYAPIPPELFPPCDEDFGFQYIIECPFTCEPDPAECNETLWLGFTITCLNIPPCPEPLVCRDFPANLAGVVTDVPACFCTPGAPECAQDEAAVIVQLITTGPLCDCDGFTGTEQSGWGRVKNLFR